MDAALNESLKNSCKAKECIKTYLEMGSLDNKDLLLLAIDLLEMTEEVLTSQI